MAKFKPNLRTRFHDCLLSIGSWRRGDDLVDIRVMDEEAPKSKSCEVDGCAVLNGERPGDFG